MPTVTTYDALLTGLSWNGWDVSARPAFVTYSFDTSAPASYTGEFPAAFLSSFQAFSAADQTIARDALNAWANVSGLTLFEVPAGQGDIRFGVYDFRLGPEDIEDSAGFAYNPFVYNYDDGADEDPLGGDIFIDIGQVNFDVLIHEVGHALGLKHPFDDSPTLDTTLDDLAHTVMTYNPVGGPAKGLGTLDVQAVQFLYGAADADGTQAASWSWDPVRYVLTQAGGPGDDSLAGVAVADRITAGAGNDYVMTRAGADQIDGDAGADTLAGGEGGDTLNGGADNDIIDGDDGDDIVDGGDGDDDIWGIAGADTLSGGAGDDTLNGGSGINRLIGGAGDDLIVIFDGRAVVDGGDGYDGLELVPTSNASMSLSYANLTAGGGSFTGIEAIVMFGAGNADTLQGGALEDLLVGDAGADSLVGAAANDSLFGQAGADYLLGGDGNDLLSGETGADTISGGDGTDLIDAWSGDDSVTAGAGNDTVTDLSGSNYLRGDEGNDSIGGGANFDDINGNMGDDTAVGGAGDDWVVGGKDNDTLSGDSGNDLVYGNIGNDTCEGGDGNDTVRGGQDNDSVSGGAGADFISGDKGDDTMAGGAGADIFHTFGESGIDRVTDFNIADGDRVMVDPGTVYTVAQVGSDTIISMTGGGQMTLVGVTMTTLTGAWIFGA